MTADSSSSSSVESAISGNHVRARQNQKKCWYVMRDLKRPNAKQPAYKVLQNAHFEVFVPLEWKVVARQGKRKRVQVPVIRDLLFVHSEKHDLDVMVDKDGTLQYRYLKGGGYCVPMVVRNKDMDRFMAAVNSTQSPVFYSPEEITPDMVGSKVRIIGGPLDGYEVSLLKIRGSRKKHIFVDLPGVVAVSVEVEPDFIRFV